MSRGIIQKQIGAEIKPHEQRTADFLASQGYDLLFIAPDRTKGSKNPDIEMYGLLWELKSPEGNGSRTIENIMRAGSKQARNIVLDLRRTSRVDSKCLAEIKSRFAHLRSVKRALIITKSLELIELHK